MIGEIYKLALIIAAAYASFLLADVIRLYIKYRRLKRRFGR